MDPVRLASTATRLIEENGVPVVLKAVRNTEYDTSTSSVDGSERNFNGLGFPYDYDLREIDGEDIRRGDVRVLLSVVTERAEPMPEPKSGDRMLIQNEHWRVMDCSPIKLKGRAVVYLVQVRK